MTDKKNNIKLMLQVLIDNIDEFGSKFVTYKAESMEELLENTLEYIKAKERECEELETRLNIYEQAFEQLEDSFSNNPYIDGGLASYYIDIIEEAKKE